MPCNECRELSTHVFRTEDDLIEALRVAAQETDRGVLERVATTTREPAEEEALASALEHGAMPALIEYRFRCQLCGDGFTLVGNTRDGSGGWTRDETEPAGKVTP